MPWRLHRYLLVDLLRIIGLTTLVLVVVTAFGAVIKPLASGVPLSPGQAALYILLSAVPMLQYVLPFAAGFGTTLVMHRLASDNEVVAMAAAGMPYRVILGPVIALAVVLSVGLTVLANTAIPQVYAVMGRVLTGDIITLLEHSVRNGKPLALGDMQIWAEGMRVEPAPNGIGQRVQLHRVAAAQIGASGAISGDVSARGAVLDFVERDGVLEVRMVMEDAVSWDADGGGLRGFPRIEPTHPVLVPMPQRTEPAAMTWMDMDDIRRTPTRYPAVRAAFNSLRRAVVQQNQRAALQQRLGQRQGLTLTSLDRPEQTWLVHADALRGDRLVRAEGSVSVVQMRAGVPVATFTPEDLRLRTQPASVLDHASGETAGHTAGQTAMLNMTRVRVDAAQEGIPSNHRAAVDIANLHFVPPLDVQDIADDQMVAEGRRRGQSAPWIQERVDNLERAEDRLDGQITSRRWRRFALGLAAGLLPLLGAVLALLLRHAQPLAVYMVGFLPGLLDLMLISGGSGTIRHGDLGIGLLVMFSGSGIVIIATCIAWNRLRKN
jgi:lipopolysaccharide export LptBFGC system permease protein LptF